MTAPPGLAPEHQPDLGARIHEGVRRDGYLSVPVLSREARKVADDLDLRLSGSRIRNLVRRYVDTGRAAYTDERRLVDDFRTWFIAYADPTGETVVNEVLRGRTSLPPRCAART